MTTKKYTQKQIQFTFTPNNILSILFLRNVIWDALNVCRGNKNSIFVRKTDGDRPNFHPLRVGALRLQYFPSTNNGIIYVYNIEKMLQRMGLYNKIRYNNDNTKFRIN